MANGFLGRGMAFPPEIDPATGRFKMSEGEQSVRESIWIILMTQTTERFLRPNFGTEIASYVFMDTSLTALTMMRRELADRLLAQEPRIDDVNIEMDTEERKGYIMFNIDYRIAATGSRDNLVFPFYMNTDMPAPEGEVEYYEPEIIDVGE